MARTLSTALLLLLASAGSALAICGKLPGDCPRGAHQTTYANRPTCNAAREGVRWGVTNCATNACNAGGGSIHCDTHCDGTSWNIVACDGTGNVGAPTTGPNYWTENTDGQLSGEHALGALGIGLVVSTNGTPSIFAGTTCPAGSVMTGTGASGTAVCAVTPLTDAALATSAQLAALLGDETGIGSVVFNGSPLLVTPRIQSYQVSALPAPGTVNRIAVVTDAATGVACTPGGGQYHVLCRDTGALWEPIGGGGGGGGAGNLVTAASSATVGALAVASDTTGHGVTWGNCVSTTNGINCPVDATTGGCWSVKESSNHGTNVVQHCAPAALSGPLRVVYNADGTQPADSVETVACAGQGAIFGANGKLTCGVPIPTTTVTTSTSSTSTTSTSSSTSTSSTSTTSSTLPGQTTSTSTTSTSTSTSSTSTTSTTSTSSSSSTTSSVTSTTSTSVTTSTVAGFYVRLPGSGAITRKLGSTLAQAVTQMSCISVVPDRTLPGIIKVGALVGEGWSGSHNCGICLYTGDGATLLGDGGGMTCAAGSYSMGPKTISSFTISEGTKYRLCWLSDNATVTFGSARPVISSIRNAFTTVEDGIAASTVSGSACPQTTGALTPFSGASCSTVGEFGNACVTLPPDTVWSSE